MYTVYCIFQQVHVFTPTEEKNNYYHYYLILEDASFDILCIQHIYSEIYDNIHVFYINISFCVHQKLLEVDYSPIVVII